MKSWPAQTPSDRETQTATMPIQLNLCAPTRQVAEVEAEYIQIPSAQGKMEVLKNHAPLRCVLEPGVVTCRLEDGSERVFAVSSGLAMIRDNRVLVMADAAEKGEDIDVARAEAAMERARERLHRMGHGVDLARAEAALKRALARLEATRH